MLLVPLVHHPALAEVLAGWHFHEWHDLYPGWSLAACLDELRTHTGPDRIPTTLVALDGEELLGSVSLLLDDLPGHEHLSPWLASLYVRPDRRGRGVGGLLVEAAVAEARRLGVARLYLFTPGHREYYASRGWTLLEEATLAGRAVAVMARGPVTL